MKKIKGKLIVIDGTDGSGKATQSKILIKKLKKMGREVKYLDFPRYKEFYGKLTKRFFKGEFGEMESVSPYLVSMLIAADRHCIAGDIKKWLAGGYIIVANRYTSSNMGHQTARLKKSERKEFLNWLDEMEYEVNGLPREDVTLFLNVPTSVSRELMNGRKKDIAEKDVKHQIESLKVYSKLAEEKDNWIMIECCDEKGKMGSREEIGEKVWKVLQSRIFSK